MGKIIEILKSKKVLLSDGAWGTYLQQKGLKTGECPELWNRTHREDVLEIAKSYVDAGADMIETNTFGGGKLKLLQYDLANDCYELNKLGAEISREAAGDDVLVLGSVGPTGKFLMMGEVSEDEMYDSFKIQMEGLRDGGVDAICIETFYAIDEAEQAIKAAKENTDLDVICTFTFEISADNKFNTMMGVTPEQMVESVVNAGADVTGTNCGIGFKQMIEIVKEIRKVNTDKPLLVHANAGLPELKDNELVYPDTPGIMADLTPGLIDAGANIIGGCCGTTPEHIKAIKQKIESKI